MFDFLFNPNGRISRKGYLIGFLLPYLALYYLPDLFLPAVNGIGIAVGLLGLFFLWPSLVAVPVKRLHDLGLTGWFQLLFVIITAVLMGYGMFGFILEVVQNPELAESMGSGNKSSLGEMKEVLSLIKNSGNDRYFVFLTALALPFLQMIAFALLPGQRAENKYGNDPLVSGRGFAD